MQPQGPSLQPRPGGNEALASSPSLRAGWSEHSILISSTGLPRNLFIRKLCLIEIILTPLSSVSLQFITTSGEGGRQLSGSLARILQGTPTPHPGPVIACVGGRDAGQRCSSLASPQRGRPAVGAYLGGNRLLLAPSPGSDLGLPSCCQ